jgi:hypothetical protein
LLGKLQKISQYDSACGLLGQSSVLSVRPDEIKMLAQRDLRGQNRTRQHGAAC